MGSSHSVMTKEGAPPKPPAPRNKLTKPRTSAPSNRQSCVTNFTLGSSRLSLLGLSRFSSEKRSIQDHSSAAASVVPSLKSELPSSRSDDDEYAISNHQPSIVNLRSPRDSLPRRNTIQLGHSTATMPERPVSVTTPGTLLRRKSQLSAAPPATATRRPVPVHRHTVHTSSSTGHMDAFLAPPSRPQERCISPSTYSVTGVYKRGSLRITNGTASPCPSSIPDSPHASVRERPILGVSLESLDLAKENRAVKSSGSTMDITDRGHPGIRLVTPSTISDGDSTRDIRVPHSPFSFMDNPSLEQSEDFNRDHYESAEYRSQSERRANRIPRSTPSSPPSSRPQSGVFTAPPFSILPISEVEIPPNGFYENTSPNYSYLSRPTLPTKSPKRSKDSLYAAAEYQAEIGYHPDSDWQPKLGAVRDQSSQLREPHSTRANSLRITGGDFYNRFSRREAEYALNGQTWSYI